jgi:hypothetical protein
MFLYAHPSLTDVVSDVILQTNNTDRVVVKLGMEGVVMVF